MSLKRYTKLLGLVLALFISGSVFGQWDGLDPIFNPSSGGSGVSVNPVLSMTFNGANDISFEKNGTVYIYEVNNPSNSIELITGTSGFFGKPMDSRINIIDNVIYFDLSEDILLNNTLYGIFYGEDPINIDSQIYSGLSNFSTWTFTTISAAPSILTYTPTQDATDVAINQDLVLTFDENIQIGTSGSFSIYEEGGTLFQTIDVSDAGNINISATALTITHDDFVNEKSYYVNIDAGFVTNTSGVDFEGLNDNTTWAFSTIDLPPLPPLHHTNLIPNNGTSGIALDADLIIEFNEDIFLGTNGILYFRIHGPDQIISLPTTSAYVSVNGKLLTVTHSSDNNFKDNSSYYVTIDEGFVVNASGAEYEDITDPSDWAFSTAPTIPTVTFTPSSGDDGVSTQTTIVLQYSEAMQKVDDSPLEDEDLGGLITLESGEVDATAVLTYTATISSDKKTITITPADILPSFTRITTTIEPLKGIDGGVTEELSSYFSTDKFITWTGSNSTDITDDGNWDGTFVSGISIHIPKTVNKPVVGSGTFYVRNIIIDAGAALTIESGATVTVAKELELRSSDVSAEGNANLLVEGTLYTTDADVVVQQYLPISLIDWHFSSPVTSATRGSTGITNTVYSYDSNAGGVWNTLSEGTQLNPGTGYLTYAKGAEIVTFDGDINNTNIGPIHTFDNGSVWNLIGNPFPCSVNWDKLDKINMTDEFYILNRNGNYGVYNGNVGAVNLDDTNPNCIPSCHAVWTKVEEDQDFGSITFPLSSRVITDYSYLKSTQGSYNQEFRFAGVNGAGVDDELLLVFNPDADDDYDRYDSERKMSSNKSLLQLYTIHSAKKLVIDTYSSISSDNLIVLGYKVGEAGTYQIKLKNLININSGVTVHLEDTYEGTNTLLGLEDSYSFETLSGSFDDRFILQIKDVSTNNEKLQDSYGIKVFTVNKSLTVRLSELTNPRCEIYNIKGQLIHQQELISNSSNIILPKEDGMLIVKVISDENVNTQKVLLKK